MRASLVRFDSVSKQRNRCKDRARLWKTKPAPKKGEGERQKMRKGKDEAKGKRARGQREEPSEIKNSHGDGGRHHFTILLEIIRVYFFSSSRLLPSFYSFLFLVSSSTHVFDCARIDRVDRL